MKSRSTKRSESGFISVEYMVACAFSLLFLVMMTNLVVVQFGRGIVRASVDEAVRVGARVVSDPIEQCNKRARNMLDNQVGRIGSNVEVTCTLNENQIQATAIAKFEPWLPGIPEITQRATAVSIREVAPQ